MTKKKDEVEIKVVDQPMKSSKVKDEEKISPENKTVESPNLEIFTRMEACPFCGSHISHLSRFTIYWQCGICKTRFVGRQKI